MRWKRESTKGQSLVEMSVALPLLLLILLGTIDMGRMFFDYITMRNAAVEGATYASRRPTDTAGITAAVTDHGIPGDATVGVSTSGDCVTPGASGAVTVTASRVWTPISIDILSLIDSSASWSYTMNASSTMRCFT